MSKFLSQRLLSLAPYVPGEQPQDKKYIKLNTNENPYPPCKGAFEIMNDTEAANLKLYSDPECKLLTKAASNHFGIKPENIIFGNGSDEILAFAFTAFCDKDTGAAFPNISYGFYKVFAELNCLDYTEIPLNEDFTINPENYYNAGKTIFIANPNAPTGIMLSVSDIENILKNNPDNVVVIDEAYVDFGGESCVPLINKYENLLVVQTFSKSRSLAGARLGFGIGCKELIDDLQRVRNSNNPYNINRLTQAMGAASITDFDYFKECTNKIISTRTYLTDELQKRNFAVLSSKTNFVFAKSSKTKGEDLYLKLKEKGILVRYFNKTIINDYLRITVGTDEEIKSLISAIDEIEV